MPSWNVHTAHVERLLGDHDPGELGIRDTNAFLFGNYVPDVYVGYMVSPLSHRLPYRETHFVDPGHVPEPRFWEFWERYGLPSADEGGRVSDVVLGAWCHLVADNGYNHEVNLLIARRGVVPGDMTRRRKQHDFDLFGHTLGISMQCAMSERLVSEARGFPQYAIERDDLRRAVASARRIVRSNHSHERSGPPPTYSLIQPAEFDRMFRTVHERLEAGLAAYARLGADAPLLRTPLPHASAADA
ncbi:hypothetical protein [Olsenella sp. HMSC062G07]|uniref:hypothetical protein n=1 Tax=Olsenella sp. HMSC062G07 TaxID=1739330 RepID=UPI0008A57AC3|nr:hypothetical protein [Olsenella sp. HMSC062G07]OFK23431.1 hypothetical protein HMPREF2826_04950 [Olsenella sp. HMSC062G07]